jgi:hypothetical protein
VKVEKPKAAAKFQEFLGINPKVFQKLVSHTRQTTHSWWSTGLPLIG